METLRATFVRAGFAFISGRRYDVVESLQAVVDSGRNLIIKCDSEAEKVFFEDSLAVPDDRKLTVIMAPIGLFAGS